MKNFNNKNLNQQSSALVDSGAGLAAEKAARNDRRAAEKAARHDRKAADKAARRNLKAAKGEFAEWTEAVAADRIAAARSAEIKLDEHSLSYLPGVIFLGGYTGGSPLAVGVAYDLRFLENRLIVLWCGSVDVLVEIPYSDAEAIDIGGPGLVKSGGGFFGGGFGIVGMAEGMAIATLLNALTAHAKIKTVIRVQGAGCELFLLHTKAEPEALRIELSRSLGAIRLARSARPDASEHRGPEMRTSLTEELSKLAAMLDNGLLTREEFDHLKAKLIAEAG